MIPLNLSFNGSLFRISNFYDYSAGIKSDGIMFKVLVYSIFIFEISIADNDEV